MYPQSMFLSKNKKNIKKNISENEHFYSREILLYIAWACFRNVNAQCIIQYEAAPQKCNKVAICAFYC